MSNILLPKPHRRLSVPLALSHVYIYGSFYPVAYNLAGEHKTARCIELSMQK